MEFGEKIKEVRQSLGLTQNELGRAVGVTQQAIFKYESGIAYPCWQNLMNLVRVLDLDANEILKT